MLPGVCDKHLPLKHAMMQTSAMTINLGFFCHSYSPLCVRPTPLNYDAMPFNALSYRSAMTEKYETSCLCPQQCDYPQRHTSSSTAPAKNADAQHDASPPSRLALIEPRGAPMFPARTTWLSRQSTHSLDTAPQPALCRTPT